MNSDKQFTVAADWAPDFVPNPNHTRTALAAKLHRRLHRASKDKSVSLAILVVFAKLLNGLENYQVSLIPLATKKEIGCSGQYCAEVLTVASPDDEYTEIALEVPTSKGRYIEREYKCKAMGHVTKVYWYHKTHSLRFTVT